MLVLTVGLGAADLRAQSGAPQAQHRATANLHITANVIPVVQAAAESRAPLQQSAPIAYNFEIPRKYEQHIVLRPVFANPREPAVVKTLIVVPE